jgi:NADH-quinone oxidoreductase subunit L
MNLIALILLAPLVAALLILALRRAPEAIALAGITISFLAALGFLAATFSGGAAQVVLPGLPEMPLRLTATPLTSVLSALVATVAAFVLLYAVGYMRKDPEKPRFFGTMLLFVTAMQTLVLAGDWITLLAAWELIGFSSYLLIGFWYRRAGVASAATRAFIYTRSADLGLYIGIFVLISAAGTTEISATLSTTGPAAVIAGLLLLVAAMGKSAQAPLHDWLQRAMAGPTPVSALLHSATLVAAGAILLIRSAPMLPPQALLAVGVVGGVTAVLAGLMALGERDLKRLLAASTSSQYGLMLVAVGAGAPVAALLHLIAHAAIKSSLFLGAGVFQHDRGSTAMDNLAGAGRARPFIFAGFALSALALAGIPPLSGFFSKDAIIAAALSGPGAAWLAPLALAGTVLTGAYMARALNVLWSGKPKATTGAGVIWMGAGIAVLVALAAVLAAGFPALEHLLEAEPPGSTLAVVLGLAAALTGLALGWFVSAPRLMGPILPWAQRGFAVAGGFNGLMLRPAMAIAQTCERFERVLYNGVLAIGRLNLSLGLATRQSDERGIDGMIFGLVRGAIAAGGYARRLQSGLIHRELALTILGAALIAAVLIAAPYFYS